MPGRSPIHHLGTRHVGVHLSAHPDNRAALLRDPAGDRPLSDPHVRPRELRVGRINQYPPTALAASTRPRPRGLQEGRINQYPSHIPRGPTTSSGHEGCKEGRINQYPSRIPRGPTTIGSTVADDRPPPAPPPVWGPASALDLSGHHRLVLRAPPGPGSG
ncbi:hypothetical protein RR46_00588 [Papilio xuthus]|uniref:Uncharacterized protein n=1 Tax=Papilio xuthus TaxID=66420 RepID=A0A0N1PK68_PAPXU|nr:hypothetical protein RR46_00571 [Papilio xuthus]KPJ20667.1 hypothetical protein RR46_00572 [Papilio xuthus]KPJ20668.1 hypothetical protein RR46_00573 [Papilio xuthus]KPJ20669.1 hypothetical protein RR46_00574 [Papilio xuthus]KPJ20670.1 hypothetical protein RR46_00575 [Papilio xuthus]